MHINKQRSGLHLSSLVHNWFLFTIKPQEWTFCSISPFILFEEMQL